VADTKKKRDSLSATHQDPGICGRVLPFLRTVMPVCHPDRYRGLSIVFSIAREREKDNYQPQVPKEEDVHIREEICPRDGHTIPASGRPSRAAGIHPSLNLFSKDVSPAAQGLSLSFLLRAAGNEDILVAD